MHRLVVPPDAAGQRLDQVLAQLLPQHSRSRMKAWIEAGLVHIDDRVVVAARQRLGGGEALVVTEGAATTDDRVAAQAIDLPIIHEDAAILVVDKPAGLVVHPGSGNRDGTLQNALLHHAPALATLPRAGIVHRLDKDTSGLLVVAKTAEAQTSLVRQLAARTVKREYAALVRGDVARTTTIDAPIGRHPVQRTTMAVVASGKEARTQVEPVERFGDATLVRCRLETGRTHQIRVHLAAIGHPLLGDPTYGGRRRQAIDALPALQAFRRQALHAQRLGLVHPVSRETLAFEAPLPGDIAALLAALRARARAAS
ncbi:MAG: 23S rRNA pseudouridine(1911/1915/1917) synthase RluD [Burkholderiales bacterium]|nr:23S rRNA pseudouridine(1911/1915/1917) synthase RluD [Burkholderiales bacterium]